MIRFTLLFCLFFIVCSGAEWRPVDPADLEMKTPKIDKDADAEAIFWEVHVADETSGGDIRSVLQHYIRIKIFTDRGREKHSTIDVYAAGRNTISDIAARTIKPDGSAVELKKDAVFERIVARSGGFKVKSKSFALPGVEPGAIIEYRYKETRGDQLAQYLRLYFQHSIPVRLVKYYIKPLNVPFLPYAMRSRTFQLRPTPFTKESDGFWSTFVTDVPAFREEPRMPPEDQVRAWMLIYYSEDKNLPPDKYWAAHGKEVFQSTKPLMKPNDAVKKAAASIVADAASQEEKLRRLADFCRTKIKNIYHDSSGISAEERSRIKKENRSPSDTLKNGMGSGTDINLLFAALASASGFDARIAKLPDRGDIFFDKAFTDTYFLTAYDIAVKVNDAWKFFDPGSPYVSAGMLRWQEEGVDALVVDPKEPVFVRTPVSAAEQSVTTRDAKLSLTADGTLEGTVSVTYSGHTSAGQKSVFDGQSQEQREETVRDMVKDRLSTAEISEIRLEGAADPLKPFSYSFRIKAPGYAQRTGRRIFLQPAFFQRNTGAMFTVSQRTHPVYFHYPLGELDTCSMALPEGYELDNAEAPQSFNIANVGGYDVRMAVSKDRQLVYSRKFLFGKEARILFPKESYVQLKKIFDVIHQQDNHTITLKQSVP